MHPIIEYLEKVNEKGDKQILKDIEKYLKTGDAKILARCKESAYSWKNPWHVHLEKIAQMISLPSSKDDVDFRMLAVAFNTEGYHIFRKFFENEKPGEDVFSVFLDAAGECKLNNVVLDNAFFKCGLFNHEKELINSGVRYYLELDEKEFGARLEQIGEFVRSSVTIFLLKHAPERIDAYLDSLVLYKYGKSTEFLEYPARMILESTGDKYAKRIFEIWNGLNYNQKFYDGYTLAEHHPEIFREALLPLALKEKYVSAFCFLIENFGEKYLDHVLENYTKTPYSCESYFGNTVQSILESAKDAHGKKSVSYIDRFAEEKYANVRCVALEALIELKSPEFDGKIEERLRKELRTGKDAAGFLKIAKTWHPELFIEEYWTLLANKSKTARDLAIGLLSGLEKLDMARIEKLLSDSKSEARHSAVMILSRRGDEKSLKLLQSRVDLEPNDDIRDKILSALDSADRLKGAKPELKTFEAKAKKAADKIKSFKPKWLKFETLPPLFSGKKELSSDIVRFLLYRQARCKEIKADIEVKPLYSLIDRKKSGDFALTVLEAFLKSKMLPEDRWALSIAGLLGDDRIVPLLSKQVQIWADKSRGKMAEYAVQALALLGTELALTVVSSMIIRYRTKYKNIGAAAETAFAEAAEARGVSPDELGDDVVPRLGFEFEKPLVRTVAGKDYELGIGTDFKIYIFDTEKKKKIASLPKSASKEILSELKETKESLKEVVKGQLLRIENMLVRQFRWPCERWISLYQKHPVLRPFTIRLVWGVYDSKGKLTDTFRALEDGSLCDVNDTEFKLPKDARIGIVHPLDLKESERDAWISHFADYSIAPPFPQMNRGIVLASPEEAKQKVCEKWSGTELNAMTFRGRAEKLGWKRSSVCDGGSVEFYMKPFPDAGVDAFLSLNGMYIGISMDESITLGKLGFVKSGSVKTGSYLYDDPCMESGKEDKRLIPFGKVPKVVFSEVMSEMAKISG